MMVEMAIGEGFWYVGNLADSLGPITYILKSIAGVEIVLASMLAYGALAGIPVVGPVLGAAAAALVLTKGFSKLAEGEKVGDMYSSNGKTMVSPAEGGLFQLSSNDEFAAAPGLGQMLSNNSNPQSTTVESKTDMNETNGLLKQLIATNSQGYSKLDKKQEISPVGLYEVQ